MRQFLCFCFLIWCPILSLLGQTQLPNPGFENWPGSEYSSPKGWHSFDEASGPFAKTVSNKPGFGNPAALQRTAGHSGKYAVTIRCTKILGVAANGALTTGRVHMAAMTAASPKNYCYSDVNNGYAFKFTGRPDSLYFWAKFDMNGDVQATAKAHLHTQCNFRDFVDIGQESNIASAIFYFKDAGKGKWHQYKQPFKAYDKVYKATAAQAPIPTLKTWTRKPTHMLLSFSTNRNVMSGSKGDALSIDDIRLIYNKLLSSISVDDVEVADFCKSKKNYVAPCDKSAWTEGFPVVKAHTESPRAVADVQQATFANPVAIITVYHDDVYSGEAEPVVYCVRFVMRDEEPVCDGNSPK